MPKGLIITTNDNIATVEVDSLDSMQHAVGGYIEHVSLEHAGDEVSIYLNEEGKTSNKVFPINGLANHLFGSRLAPGDMIVGDVLVLGLGDNDGNDTDLPDEVAQRIIAHVHGHVHG